MKGQFLIIGLMINLSCVNETKTNIEVVDSELEIYNDILIELVRHHFYDLYLGDEGEMLGNKYIYRRDNPDTISYERELKKLRVIVESDTSRQRVICLKNELYHSPWTILSSDNAFDSLNMHSRLKGLLTAFSTNIIGVYDSLNAAQQKYADRDFQPSGFKISSSMNSKICEIGLVSFSKIFLNEQRNNGLLYYEFVCDEKCGKGEIAVIEKKGARWTIMKTQRIWVS
jgi:hypothetical protein